jgi:hypothetical protein
VLVEALLSGSAPAREAAPPRARAGLLYGPALTLAVGLCAALPVIAAALRALHEGWQPVADRGIIATRSFDVLSSHMPLVGQYSFASTVTGKLTYSLGPMLYWLLAPAAHIGAPASFVYTMAAVNIGSIMGAVALARRRGGVWLMLAAAVGIALMCRSLAANNFYDIWNPSAGLFPLLLLIFVCWSLACGDYRLLPLAVLVASFLAQCEDAFLPPTIAAMAVGLAGLAIARFGQLRRRPAVVAAGWAPAGARQERDRRRPGRMWPWALAALVVLLVCWTPPAIDQVAHGGNFGLVVKAATERKTALGSGVGVHAVVRTVGIKPWWLTRPGEPFVRKYDVRRPASTLANVSTAVILGWLLLAIALAIRRRRQDVAAGAVLALALCAAVWAIAKATPTSHLLSATLGYTLWSATTVGMFVWLMALWTAVVLSGADALLARARASLLERARGRPAVRALGLALGAVAVLVLAGIAGAMGAAAGRGDEHAFEFPALKTINSRLGAVPAGHSVFLDARLDGLITPLRPEITYDLRRRGVRALGNGAYLRTGHWYERAEHPYDYVVWVYDNNRLPAPGARVIAVASIESGGRRHAVDVAISPVRPRSVHAGAVTAPTGSAASTARTVGAAQARASGAGVSGGWAPVATLPGCPPIAAPVVVFPSEGPSHPTGAGAIVWSSLASCGGAQASTAGPVSLSLSALSSGSSGERVAGPSAQPLRLAAAPLAGAVGASFGRVAVALAPAQAGAAAGQPSTLEGVAKGKLTPVLPGGMGAPLALAHAYLGDVALASVTPGAIGVRVQRYFAHRFGPTRSIPIPAGRVSALTATMDYRSDVLLAWQQNGSIYAHMLRAFARTDPTQRLGPSGPDPQLQALVSDNDHGMVAWSSTDARPGASPRTSIHVTLSKAGVRFGAPRLLASYADPARAGDRPGSLALVRLASENVVLAWTAAERGRYVVRAAPAVFAATRPTTLLSDPARDAVLADLAPGPAGEAIALWSSPAGTSAAGAAGAHGSELWAARTFIARGDRLLSGQRARIAAAGPNGAASVAVDPRSDRAVAAWRTQGAGAHVAYAIGPGSAGYRPGPGATALPGSGSGTHWLRIAVAVLAVAALALAGTLGWRRRHRPTAGALRRRR